MISGLVRHAAISSELRARRRASLYWLLRRGFVAVAWLSTVSLVGFLTVAVFAPRSSTKCPCISKVDVARLVVKRLAFEGYPEWRAAHPDEVCPRSLRELAAVAALATTRDVWGNPMELRCGKAAPPGAHPVWIRSGGPDGELNTDDDITSAD